MKGTQPKCILQLSVSVALFCLSDGAMRSTPRAAAPPGRDRDGIIVEQTVCTAASPACVWTYHNEDSRDGVNSNETILTPQNVASLTVLKSVTTDGLIYGQPLYISQIPTTDSGENCGGGTASRNMVYVATENDSVYGFDDVAGDVGPCWQTSLVPAGETPVPWTSLPMDPETNGMLEPCSNLVAQIGITGTPVIDINVTPPIMYAVAYTVDGVGTVHVRLHLLRLRDGKDLAKFDVDSTAGLGSTFNPAVQDQRAGLALFHQGSTSTVYLAFASYCDCNKLSSGITSHPYTGWVIAFQLDYSGGGPTPNLVSSGAFEVGTPPVMGTAGGIWMGGAAPSIDDSSGTVFVTSANGLFDGSANWGDTVLQLHSGLANSLDDWYTPNDYHELQKGGEVCQSAACPPGADVDLKSDSDLGASAVVLLSTSSLTLNHPELITSGKEGILYVTWYGQSDPPAGQYNDLMGGLDGGSSCGYSNPGCVVTPAANDCTPAGAPAPGTVAQCWEGFSFVPSRQDLNGGRGSVAFIDGGSANNYLYTSGINDTLRAFQFQASQGVGTFNTTAVVPPHGHSFLNPGASPVITWDGSNFGNAIVWTVDTSGFGSIKYDSNGNPIYVAATKHASVYAYAAQPSAGALTLLWSDTTNGPDSVKFVLPTIANGMLFVAGGNNNPPYTPGTTNGTTNCSTIGPTNCGELVIWHEAGAGRPGSSRLEAGKRHAPSGQVSGRLKSD